LKPVKGNRQKRFEGDGNLTIKTSFDSFELYIEGFNFAVHQKFFINLNQTVIQLSAGDGLMIEFKQFKRFKQLERLEPFKLYGARRNDGCQVF